MQLLAFIRKMCSAGILWRSISAVVNTLLLSLDLACHYMHTTPQTLHLRLVKPGRDGHSVRLEFEVLRLRDIQCVNVLVVTCSTHDADDWLLPLKEQ